MRRTPLDPIQLRSNRFYQPPTLLAMSSIRSAPDSRVSFKADNDGKKIARVDNRRHLHSRIEPTMDYPTPYEVR